MMQFEHSIINIKFQAIIISGITVKFEYTVMIGHHHMRYFSQNIGVYFPYREPMLKGNLVSSRQHFLCTCICYTLYSAWD